MRACTEASAEFDGGDGPSWSPDLLRRATWGFAALGVLLRLVRYLMNFPLWGDEAFLAVNFIDRGYLDLMRPLSYAQISPLLFLWAERSVVGAFGFNEWSLRLFPTACGVASIPLFCHTSGRLTRGVPRLLAVAVFAVSVAPIRHGGEVKPYATDLLVSLALLALAVEWLRAREASRWLWALAGFVPIALGSSYPAVFIAGGIGLGLAPAVWRNGSRRVLAAFGTYLVALIGSFATLFLVFTRSHLASVKPGLSNYWAGAFPPISKPADLLIWLLRTHTGRLFAYPVGGDRGASALTLICFAACVVVLWKRGRKTLLATCLAPFGLAMLASVLGLYPYGGSTRVVLYLGPVICLFTGVGAAAILAKLRSPRTRSRATRGFVIALGVWGMALLGVDVACPYRSIHDAYSRDFARWFWTAKAMDADLVCVKVDLGREFQAEHWRLFRTALYQSLQKIYSPRHRRGIQRPDAVVSAARPLRCVLYNEGPRDNPTIAQWLDAMSARYELRGSETYVVNGGVGSKETGFEDRYLIYEFVPRPTGPEDVPERIGLSRDRPFR